MTDFGYGTVDFAFNASSGTHSTTVIAAPTASASQRIQEMRFPGIHNVGVKQLGRNWRTIPWTILVKFSGATLANAWTNQVAFDDALKAVCDGTKRTLTNEGDTYSKTLLWEWKPQLPDSQRCLGDPTWTLFQIYALIFRAEDPT